MQLSSHQNKIVNALTRDKYRITLYLLPRRFGKSTALDEVIEVDMKTEECRQIVVQYGKEHKRPDSVLVLDLDRGCTSEQLQSRLSSVLETSPGELIIYFDETYDLAIPFEMLLLLNPKILFCKAVGSPYPGLYDKTRVHVIKHKLRCEDCSKKEGECSHLFILPEWVKENCNPCFLQPSDNKARL